MKHKVINAAICDAREVTEESLAGFESITINAAILITGERSGKLLNRYPVTMNVANMLEVPDGQDIVVKRVNGACEIGPEADGTGVFLMVNGTLTIAGGSLEAAKRYYRIMVNGKLLAPESCRGQLRNLIANGKTLYYPDGAAILKAGTEINDLFLARASHPAYYAPGSLFFLDTGMDTAALAEKGLNFGAEKIIIAKSLLDRLVGQLGEEAELICVPDGTRRIDGDLEMKAKTIRKYGPKLFVCGDVTIQEPEALAALEYLYAEGTVCVRKDLEAAFEEIESVCDGVRVMDPDRGYILDRPMVKIGPAMFRQHPKGVTVEDCAKVTLSEELDAGEIMEKLRISDCAMVVCSREQEEAVNLIAREVAMIRVSGQDPEDGAGGMVDGIVGAFFGKPKDTQVVNSAEYKM